MENDTDIGTKAYLPDVLQLEGDLYRPNSPGILQIGIGDAGQQQEFIEVDQGCPIREPGAKIQNPPFIALKSVCVTPQFRPGADQAHIAHEHVVQLRDLIELGGAQQFPQFGYSRIFTLNRSVSVQLSAPHHGPELHHEERLAKPAHAFAAEENGAAIEEPNGETNDQLQWCAEEQAERGCTHIDKSLQHCLLLPMIFLIYGNFPHLLSGFNSMPECRSRSGRNY